MKNSKLVFIGLIALAVVISSYALKKDSTDPIDEAAIEMEAAELPGATVLAFGPDNVLFIGDSKSAVVHAVATKGEQLKDNVPFNMVDFDQLLAKKLGVEPRDVIINDMKIHPKTQEAYLAVQKGHEPGSPSMIAVVNPMSQEIRFLDLNGSSKVSVKDPASDDLVFYRTTPASSLTITDIDYHEGFIYVAGLSNGEFASSLRKIAYPFNKDQTMPNSIEVYHAVHTQKETRAPIRTMTIVEVGGESVLLASYTCTPLVVIPLSEIQAGKDIKGKTIAELGYGNTPIDMITYMTQGQDGSYSQNILITHKHRSGSLIAMADLEKAATQGEGMAGISAMAPMGTEGMQIGTAPTAATLHMDVQNQMMVTALKRNIETGGLDLVSEIAGAFLRLSEFVSEYDFPDYRYSEKQEMTKQQHDMMKPMEGYPELMSDKTGK
jgi:hypothetical protein